MQSNMCVVIHENIWIFITDTLLWILLTKIYNFVSRLFTKKKHNVQFLYKTFFSFIKHIPYEVNKLCESFCTIVISITHHSAQYKM